MNRSTCPSMSANVMLVTEIFIRTKDIYTDKGQIWWANIRGGGAYIQEEKYFNCQSVKLAFLSFFRYKVRVSEFLTSYKYMWNMFKVNNKDTRTCKVNDKVKNKDTVDVALSYLLRKSDIFSKLDVS